MTSTHYRRAAIAAWMAAGLIVLFIGWATHAHAHDWYSGAKDPQTMGGCCGGHDCAPIPLDADWIQPVANGFHVVMTLEQSQTINPMSVAPIDAFVPWNRVQSPPASAEGPPALYHVCISPTERRPQMRGGIYCLFAVPSL